MKKNSQGKKLISFALVFALLISLFSILPLTASAADAVGTTFKVGSLTYTVTDDTLNTVSVTSHDEITSVNIPANVVNSNTEYKVTSIGSRAFSSCTSLTHIVFPSTMLNIGMGAFMSCTDLKEIEFNSDVDFGMFAFNGCTALEKVVCNSANIKFQSNPFPVKSQLKSELTIYGYKDSTAQTYANAQGYKFEEMENVLPQEEDDTIFSWKKLNEEDGEDGPVEIVGFKAGNENTSEVVIPSVINKHPVTAIGASAFKNNQNITKITIPESVITIKDSAFYYMPFLYEVTFAENSKLETIEANAFAGIVGAGTTDRMSIIELPSSLKSIGDNAFYSRKALGTVRVLSKDVTFGKDVFTIFGAEKNNAKIYGYEGSTAETYAKDNSLTFRYLYPESENLPENLQTLYDQAKAIDSSLYTKESYAALSEVMNTAKKLTGSGKNDATPDEIRQCIADLQAAIDGLVSAQTETTAPETTVLAETTVAPETTAPDVTEATTAAPETTAPGGTTIEVLLGDADGSGKVDVKDVTHIQKHIASYFTLEGTAALAADVDGNGTIDVNDATLVQKYLAAYNVDYKIGEVVQLGSDTPAPTADNPQPTEEQPTTAAAQPTNSPEPTTATAPAETEPDETVPEGSIMFYVTNYVSWLNNDGCKLWVYNEDTNEFKAAEEYDSNDEGLAGYFYFYLPEDWVNLSIYRTAFDVTKETFDRTSKYDQATGKGIIINSWEKLPERGNSNSFKVTSDGKGYYETFDPDEKKPDENERTIYFDNSQTRWTSVYIYGWSYGLSEEAEEMEPLGNDIWAYTFYDNLPVDGVQGFLFTDRYTSKASWVTGTKQTVDLATEEGKNLFVPTPGNGNISGTWDVYNP